MGQSTAAELGKIIKQYSKKFGEMKKIFAIFLLFLKMAACETKNVHSAKAKINFF